ncbi:MAG: response regulator, partial [Verrucomicrobia bacterium TMED71]
MKKNVLLVEDDPALRMVVREVLKGDFNIDEADNGIDGIEKGVRNEADLIILDYHLPKQDGLEVIEAVKKANPSV